MGKNDKLENQNGNRGKASLNPKKKEYLLTSRTKKWIKAILLFLVAIIITLSFLEKAGMLGHWLAVLLKLLLGDSKITITTIILSLFAGGFVLLKSHKKAKIMAILLAICIAIVGVSGLSSNQSLNDQQMGLVGFVAKLLVNGFGLLVSNIIFSAIILIALFIFLQFIWHEFPKEEKKFGLELKSSDAPNFRIKGVEPEKPEQKLQPKTSLFKQKPFDAVQGREKVPVLVNASLPTQKGKYALPPIDLLSKNETVPTSGNIKENSLIIKKTLENFGIPVEMAEVNVGPAVTQY